MSLNKEDISKIGYKAKIKWLKERAYDISDGKITLEDFLKESSPDFETQKHGPEELVGILNDLASKAVKLQDKIFFLSEKLTIPIDKDKMPDLSMSVALVDPSSAGEYISYKLYDKLIREQEFVNNQISLDYVLSNATGDSHTNSAMIQDRIYSAYSSYPDQDIAKDNYAQRYTNRWLNNAISWNSHDYQVRQIINFSDNYLDLNPDPAYIPWSMRRDVGEERVDSENLSGMWKRYSNTFSGEVKDFFTGASALGSLRPNPTIHDLTTRYINYANNFLNKANEMFDMEWAVDLVCCFMQWGIRLDAKTLKGIRALLQLLQTNIAFDVTDILNGIKDIINNIFRGLLCNQLIGAIDHIIQKLVDPVKKWLNNPDSETWKKIFACTPIDELINKYIMQAIQDLEEKLYKLIQSWYKKIELKNIKNSIKLELKTNQKWMGELSKLLDSIIAVMEMASKCGIQGSPNDEVVQQVTSNYNIGDTTKYVFPDDPNPNIYNSFIPVDPKSSASSAEQPRTSKFDSGAIGGKVSTNKPMALSDCLKKMPIEDILGVQDWMLEPKTNAQGEVQ